MSSVKSIFIQNLRWQYVSNIVQIVLGGAYILILGRYLGASGFGTYAKISSVVTVVGQFFEMRLHEVIGRDLCDINSENKCTASAIKYVYDLILVELCSRVLPCLLVFAATGYIAKLIQINSIEEELIYYTAIAYATSRNNCGVAIGLLRVLGHSQIVTSILIFDWVLRILLCTVLIIFQKLSVKTVSVIGGFVGLVIWLIQIRWALVHVGKLIKSQEVVDWSAVGIYKRLKGSIRLIIANIGLSIADMFSKDLDITLASKILTPSEIGLYKMAKTVAQVFWRVVDPMYVAIMPELQRLWQSEKINDVKVLIKNVSVQMLGLSLFVVLVGNIACSLVIVKILGPGYVGLPTVVQKCSVWIVLCAPLIWCNALAVAVGWPEVSILGSLVGAFVGYSIYQKIVPQYQLDGVLIGWNLILVSTFFSTTFMSVFLLNRKLNKNERNCRS